MGLILFFNSLSEFILQYYSEIENLVELHIIFTVIVYSRSGHMSP